MANGDRSANAAQPQRPDDHGADRGHEGAEPSCAFEAGTNFKEEARKNCRILAGSALQDFIYTQTGYDPAQQIPAAWQLFHDRVSLVYDSVPAGHFSIFQEIADLIVILIRGGAPVGPSFIRDGSVGIQWGKHWTDDDLDGRFGTRIKYEHE
jgi:hypothetical protein